MTTTLSSKGQLVIPRATRDRLRLVPGTQLSCEVQGDSIVLKPLNPRPLLREQVIDEISGLRVVKRSGKGSLVTTEQVKALLADFP